MLMQVFINVNLFTFHAFISRHLQSRYYQNSKRPHCPLHSIKHVSLILFLETWISLQFCHCSC
jgi:hypothetical protein